VKLPGSLSTIGQKANRVIWSSDRPVISFTFDDFPRSAYRRGGAVLEEQGIRATYYAAFGHMRTEGQVSEEDLACLVEDGNEIGCHTYSHPSARSVSTSDFECDCERNRTEAARLVPGVPLENFAYPFGDMTKPVVALASRHYRSARTVIQGFNSGRTDLWRLRGTRVYERMNNLPELIDRIEENAKAKGWLIFYTHDVSAEPTDYGCTPGMLQEVARQAKASGSDILTVREALDQGIAGRQNYASPIDNTHA
jgi:peptidoglycan/xylan/chitin deacetylase (PgdA/CDA1 family)